ncbi:MAG: 4-phosphoerythronate dehydrogenase [Mariprofundaceae bacterium]|nr:4-phosphoerythronate dehydrogenase [Mariprofundaceae bacterium]
MKKYLNIVADAHIWGVESAFSMLPGYDVQLHILEAANICNAALKNADVLITRSSTKVDGALLGGTPVRFAATATIGDDHYDKTYLAEHNIAFANAAGSSTGSVIEYMLTVLLTLHAKKLIYLPQTRLGIIGVGRIGGGLADICTKLNINTLRNDPPRARNEDANSFSSLDELLENADVLSLHTPLNRSGKDCTVHLLNAATLSHFKGRGIINTGRGACLDNSALLDWLNADNARFAVLDCWENEPGISTTLLAHPQVTIATPHIAGHSLDGKAANSQFAYHALCRWLAIEPLWNMQQALPPDDAPVNINCSVDTWTNLHAAATALYPVLRDDAALRSAGTTANSVAQSFANYRRHYPIRRAWSHAPIRLLDASSKAANETKRLAHAIGLQLI